MKDGVIVERLPVNRFIRRKVTLWFGMYVWQSIAEKHDLSIEDIGTIDDEQLIIEMMYYAIEYGAYKDHRRKLTLKQVERAYNLMPQKQLQRIVNTFLKSKFGGQSLINRLEESKKKQAQVK